MAALTGFEPQDLIEKTLYQYIHASDMVSLVVIGCLECEVDTRYLYIRKYFHCTDMFTGSHAALSPHPVTQGADQHKILSVDDQVFRIAHLDEHHLFSQLCLFQLEIEPYS